MARPRLVEGDQVEIVVHADPYPLPSGTKATVLDVTGLAFVGSKARRVLVELESGEQLRLLSPPDVVQLIESGD